MCVLLLLHLHVFLLAQMIFQIWFIELISIVNGIRYVRQMRKYYLALSVWAQMLWKCKSREVYFFFCVTLFYRVIHSLPMSLLEFPFWVVRCSSTRIDNKCMQYLESSVIKTNMKYFLYNNNYLLNLRHSFLHMTTLAMS